MIRKTVYWFPERNINTSEREKGLCLAELHLVIGYKERTLKGFMEMAAMLRETFPDVKDEEIHCGMISDSSDMNRCTIVWVRRVMNPKKQIPKSWSQISCTKENRLEPDYRYY